MFTMYYNEMNSLPSLQWYSCRIGDGCTVCFTIQFPCTEHKVSSSTTSSLWLLRLLAAYLLFLALRALSPAACSGNRLPLKDRPPGLGWGGLVTCFLRIVELHLRSRSYWFVPVNLSHSRVVLCAWSRLITPCDIYLISRAVSVAQ